MHLVEAELLEALTEEEVMLRPFLPLFVPLVIGVVGCVFALAMDSWNAHHP